MVKRLSVGVIGIQGAISEQVLSMQNVLRETQTPGDVKVIKNPQEIKKIDALILPGGESTTISRVLYQSGLFNEIKKRIDKGNLPIMGICAGCIILGSEMVDKTNDVKLLSAMDMEVKRNAFGRQRESFEQNIEVEGFSDSYHAVFIRAPIIEKVGNKCKILAKIDKKIVMARQDNLLALSFHPELTDDLRIHKYFLELI